MYLFLDVETTGFPKKNALIQDGQARVCQIAMILTDKFGKSLFEFCSLVKLNGLPIAKGAQEVHGFTTEQCDQYGFHFASVFDTYLALQEKAELNIAHNSEFDSGMMNIEQAYYIQHTGKGLVPARPWHCTMKTNSHIKGGKWPKLEEALKHYCNRAPTKAHDAMGDVKDCRDIFFATRKLI